MIRTNESHYERINLACKKRDQTIPVKAMYLNSSRVSGWAKNENKMSEKQIRQD